MKTSISFRLGDQALENLEYIRQKSGINRTAAVEIALAGFAISLHPQAENASNTGSTGLVPASGNSEKAPDPGTSRCAIPSEGSC